MTKTKFIRPVSYVFAAVFLSACGGGGSSSSSSGTVSEEAKRKQCVALADQGITTDIQGNTLRFVNQYAFTNNCDSSVTLKASYRASDDKVREFSTQLAKGQAVGLKALSILNWGACEASYNTNLTGDNFTCSK